MNRKRILSGMRPSGRLHLGNLHGALKNWVGLQDEYECFYFVADWHALTTEFKDTSRITSDIRDMVLDWLSAGLDGERSVIFIQSCIKEHAELHLLLSMITPLSWLERNPTYKDMLKELKGKDISTYGFLGYPVLQAADILMYKADKVPIGVDQVPHLELTREIARRFNFLYGDVFPEPEPILTETPKVPGVDGRKMSKSYDNAVFLSDSPEEIKAKISRMFTDPQRARRSDPGDPEVCPVFSYQKIYGEDSVIKMICEECPRAGIGCVDCKNILILRVVEELDLIRSKREEILKRTHYVREILEDGLKKARQTAQTTIEEVREAMRIKDVLHD